MLNTLLLAVTLAPISRMPVLCSLPDATTAPARELPEEARGIVLTLHDMDPRRSYVADVRAIVELGAKSISVIPTWRMSTIRSPRVEPGNATDAQLSATLVAAREAGLAVLVAPMIQIDELDDDEWRGVLAPPNWDEWFASYREMLVNVAGIAERGGAVAFVVGSELCSTETFTERWSTLITAVRAEFSGSLGYQANWDHRDVPTFLSSLDFLASNAYFELVQVGDRPTIEQLVTAWEPFRDDLLSWSRKLEMPLVITEVGYPSIAGGAAYPWDYTRTTPVDLEEQRRAFAALFESWSGKNAPRGLFVYEWWGAGGEVDRGYTPRGKPAEDELRAWFEATR